MNLDWGTSGHDVAHCHPDPPHTQRGASAARQTVGRRRPVWEEYNRASRVITGWLRDPDFGDGDSYPYPLRMAGKRSSFSSFAWWPHLTPSRQFARVRKPQCNALSEDALKIVSKAKALSVEAKLLVEKSILDGDYEYTKLD